MVSRRVNEDSQQTSAASRWRPYRNASLATLAFGVGLLGMSVAVPTVSAQETSIAVPGELEPEVLARGPIHEAFAEMVLTNPTPGMIVNRQPPAPIEEIPPEQRPEGDNFVWIPGYWAWDDTRNDFLWVSGTWRAAPPDARWVPGYWTQVPNGYQWTSGYWSVESDDQVQYLPEPPPSQERGPSTAAPNEGAVWVSGNWVWQDNRYAWRPGYWAQGQDNWIWIPDRYVWTPSGYIYANGYWDYPLADRGIVYAPVYFNSTRVYNQSYRYSPSVFLQPSLLIWQLFARPSYSHYYYGGYYGSTGVNSGYYAFVDQQNYVYDPLRSYYQWDYGRRDRLWNRQMRDYYRQQSQVNNNAFTWRQQQQLFDNGQLDNRQRLLTNFANLRANNSNNNWNFTQLSRSQRNDIVNASARYNEFARERARIEADSNRNGRDLKQPWTQRIPGYNQLPFVKKTDDDRNQTRDHARHRHGDRDDNMNNRTAADTRNRDDQQRRDPVTEMREQMKRGAAYFDPNNPSRTGEMGTRNGARSGAGTRENNVNSNDSAPTREQQILRQLEERRRQNGSSNDDRGQRQAREQQMREQQAGQLPAPEERSHFGNAAEEQNRLRQMHEQQARQRQSAEQQAQQAQQRQAAEQQSKLQQMREQQTRQRQAAEQQQQARQREAAEQQARQREAAEQQSRQQQMREQQQSRERQAREQSARDEQARQKQAADQARERMSQEMQQRARQEQQRRQPDANRQSENRPQRSNNAGSNRPDRGQMPNVRAPGVNRPDRGGDSNPAAGSSNDNNGGGNGRGRGKGN